ncbi:uncharacterized protein LOC112872409 isoform X1 [Panicum hallii]|uniref:uncharacterized protein LOC112872409 isoform X1 n=1 Tax=Panicum hallii TaxID=206008 RepID=UPI000DF4EBE9|nr:uncharacterized protein LOC112872409 isoform X1 [Panicum hallii]
MPEPRCANGLRTLDCSKETRTSTTNFEHLYHYYQKCQAEESQVAVGKTKGSFRWGLGGLGDGDGRVGSEVNRLRQGARVAPPLSAAPALRRPAPELGAPWRGRSTGGENLLVNSALRYGLQGPDKAAGGGAAADATIHWQAASSMLDLLVAGMALPADFFFFIWLGVFLFKPCYTLVQ